MVTCVPDVFPAGWNHVASILVGFKITPSDDVYWEMLSVDR